MINNEKLKMIINRLYGKGCKNLLDDEELDIIDTLCKITIDNKISDPGTIKHLINGIDFIYSSIPLNLTAEQIKADIGDDTLTINKSNKNETILTYMFPNGDYYAYNMSNDAPDGGEEFEKEMGWIYNE